MHPDEKISTIELVFTRLHAEGNLIKITIVVIIFQGSSWCWSFGNECFIE